MNYFLWQNKLNLLSLLFFLTTCIFVINSTNRYNNLVSYSVYGKAIITLEKVHNENNNILQTNVYKSRVSWILGWRCFSGNIESHIKDNMKFYNWQVEKFENKTVTLLNNKRQLLLSATDCG